MEVVIVFTHKAIARIVGALFIVASATAIIGGSLLLPLDESDYLTATPAAESQIVSGVLLEFVLVLSVIAIATMLYPVLRRHNSGLAMSYVGARTIESILLLAAAVSGLLILSLGREFAIDANGVQPLGESILAAREWTYLIGSLVMLGVSALILNSQLYRSGLVPTWLSIWGLLGGALILLRGLAEMYGMDLSGLAQGVLAAPIAIQEMVFAVWLIVKGFDTSGLTPIGAPAGELAAERIAEPV